jgi:hypothetical protein
MIANLDASIAAASADVRKQIATAQWKAANAIWQRELARWNSYNGRQSKSEDEDEIQRMRVGAAATATNEAYAVLEKLNKP